MAIDPLDTVLGKLFLLLRSCDEATIRQMAFLPWGEYGVEYRRMIERAKADLVKSLNDHIDARVAEALRREGPQ